MAVPHCTGASCWFAKTLVVHTLPPWLSADERRELRRLLDKMESADGVTESDAAAMTDGAKRLRDDLGGYPETGSAGSSGMAAGSQMPITKPVKGRGSSAAKKAAA